MLSDVCEAEFVMGLGSGRWLATLMLPLFSICVSMELCLQLGVTGGEDV